MEDGDDGLFGNIVCGGDNVCFGDGLLDVSGIWGRWDKVAVVDKSCRNDWRWI